ncbi:MAG: response regulator transcription factor [Chloroflexi bacterium]|nr:response regulator transcription factor [Chloroflexota bacterium]
MSSQKKITVLIADDHTIVRHGIASLLSSNEDFEVVAEAENGRDAVELAIQKRPDVVLMDIAMPILNGLEATRQIKKQLPQTKVLILSGHDKDDYILQVVHSGANGYLLKTTMAEDLFNALRSVNSGQAFFSPSVSKVIVEGYLNRDKGDAKSAIRMLTSREREILQLIAEGHLHQAIAQRLNISVRTVDTHRNNIMKKLDIHDAAGLVNYAIKNSIVIIQQ